MGPDQKNYDVEAGNGGANSGVSTANGEKMGRVH